MKSPDTERKERVFRVCVDLIEEVRSAVRPLLGKREGKKREEGGASGDITFSIDMVAEERVRDVLSAHKKVAYCTEDAGLVAGVNPEVLLIIDPIDGTRPALAGLESCCVSVAAALWRETAGQAPRFSDVFLGVVGEIKSGRTFAALKGEGVHVFPEGEARLPESRTVSDLGAIFWSTGFRGRPAEPLVTVIGDLIDLTSVSGGCFDLGSATFCVLRVVTGEMDLYLDVGQRLVEESDRVREMFLEVGQGAILNNYPHDLAAVALIAREAGLIVTDAYGKPLDGYLLLPAKGTGQISTVITGDERLHSFVMEMVEDGIRRLKDRYGD